MKAQLVTLLNQALKKLQSQGLLPEALDVTPQIERTRDASHGDFSTNLAMVLAKPAKSNPRQIAQSLIDALPQSEQIKSVDIAGPGFINFFLNQASQAAIITTILEQGIEFGKSQTGANKKIQVEFVSANPTGPLHIGHGRGGAIGDSICRLLEATGWNVTREFYYNDAGGQINNLALSVQARCLGITPEDDRWAEADWYKGDYICELADAYLAKQTVTAADKTVTAIGDANDLEAIQQFAVAYLRQEQDQDLKAFGVAFDVYYLESSLYEQGKVEETVNLLKNNGHTYSKDNALWLKTTEFGDDKDRVMQKSDGGYTYFVPDVAYHIEKWKRGFVSVINEQGSDHHSTITRVRAGLQAVDLGIPKGWPDYVLHQMVTVTRDGAEVKISKRAGSYVTLSDLIHEVGCDATRYFLVARAPTSPLIFDIDLALSTTNDNPVYYIQYAHARCASVSRKLAEQNLVWDKSHGLAHLTSLVEPQEQALLARLDSFPETIQRAAESHEPHQVANYLKDLAGEYHSWYNAHKMLVEDATLRDSRLCLNAAVKTVIHNGLDLLGVSSPTQM